MDPLPGAPILKIMDKKFCTGKSGQGQIVSCKAKKKKLFTAQCFNSNFQLIKFNKVNQYKINNLVTHLYLLRKNNRGLNSQPFAQHGVINKQHCVQYCTTMNLCCQLSSKVKNTKVCLSAILL